MPARLHVELPAMPRTGHDVTVELAIAQRPPCMRANAIERAEAFSGVKHCDNPITDGEFTAGPSGNIIGISKAMPHARGLAEGKSHHSVRSGFGGQTFEMTFHALRERMRIITAFENADDSTAAPMSGSVDDRSGEVIETAT